MSVGAQPTRDPQPTTNTQSRNIRFLGAARSHLLTHKSKKSNPSPPFHSRNTSKTITSAVPQNCHDVTKNQKIEIEMLKRRLGACNRKCCSIKEVHRNKFSSVNALPSHALSTGTDQNYLNGLEVDMNLAIRARKVVIRSSPFSSDLQIDVCPDKKPRNANATTAKGLHSSASITVSNSKPEQNSQLPVQHLLSQDQARTTTTLHPHGTRTRNNHRVTRQCHKAPSPKTSSLRNWLFGTKKTSSTSLATENHGAFSSTSCPQEDVANVAATKNFSSWKNVSVRRVVCVFRSSFENFV